MVDFPDRQIWQDFGELGFWLVGTINFYQNEMLTIGYRLQFFKVSIIQQRNDASAIFFVPMQISIGVLSYCVIKFSLNLHIQYTNGSAHNFDKKLLNNQKGFYKNVLFNGVLYCTVSHIIVI